MIALNRLLRFLYVVQYYDVSGLRQYPHGVSFSFIQNTVFSFFLPRLSLKNITRRRRRYKGRILPFFEFTSLHFEHTLCRVAYMPSDLLKLQRDLRRIKMI